MEFLITYGWAIIIMLSVIAILFYLGVFNPKTIAPASCVFPAGFACQGYKIETGGGMNGVLSLVLVQNTGHTLRITEIACTDGDPSYSTVDERIYDGGRLTMTVTCHKQDGSTPNAGEYFKGNVYLAYVDEDTNIEHRAVGEIAYRVEESLS